MFKQINVHALELMPRSRSIWYYIIGPIYSKYELLSLVFESIIIKLEVGVSESYVL